MCWYIRSGAHDQRGIYSLYCSAITDNLICAGTRRSASIQRPSIASVPTAVKSYRKVSSAHPFNVRIANLGIQCIVLRFTGKFKLPYQRTKKVGVARQFEFRRPRDNSSNWQLLDNII